MAPPDARLEIWFPSMNEVSVFTEVPGDGFDRELTETKLFAAFAASMIAALGKSAARDHLCATLKSMLSEGLHMGELKPVPATLSKGRKGFEAVLKIEPENLRIAVKPKGFGLLSRGGHFYGPKAVFALYLRLLTRQSGQVLLAQTAVLIGHVGADGKINTRSQGLLAAAAVKQALAELDEGRILVPADEGTTDPSPHPVQERHDVTELLSQAIATVTKVMGVASPEERWRMAALAANPGGDQLQAFGDSTIDETNDAEVEGFCERVAELTGGEFVLATTELGPVEHIILIHYSGGTMAGRAFARVNRQPRQVPTLEWEDVPG